MQRSTRPWGERLQEAIARFVKGPVRAFLTGQWLLLALGVAAFFYATYEFFRVEAQDTCADVENTQQQARCAANREEEQFKYGSLGAENDRGIPYPIFYVLPRVFPHCVGEALPEKTKNRSGAGGYRAFGLPWEEGRELPVGFSKKRLGFERVTQNCAICHAATYRMKREDAPTIVAAGPSHTTNTQSFLRFLRCVATDKENKFNYAGMKDEIERNFDLRLDRRLLYMAIIPIVKMRIQEQADGFDWMDQYDFRPGMRRPDWGPGRDDPMNLTKFFLLDPDGSKRKKDQTTGNADFPAIWDLSVREEHSMNWAGETRDPLAVIIDSALGLGAPPGPSFVKQMKDIRAYLQRVKPPPYPLAPAASEERVKKGRALYKVHCADCHEAGGKYFGKVVAVEDVGTDRERFDTWRQEDADGANRVAKEMGVERKDMVKDRGYMAAPISGVWLTAPYLHNGSVPNLVELLKPPGERIKTFYRGCDLYDPRNMGFLSDGSEPTCLNQFLFDTQLPGNGNGGHTYGTALDSDEKVELIEYLKTL